MVIYIAQQHHAFVTPYSGFFKTNIMYIILYGHIVYMYVGLSLLSEINDYYYYIYLIVHLNIVREHFHRLRESLLKLEMHNHRDI